jgi:hypothetical protein
MRTLRKADIESMARELQVLRRIEEQCIVGGKGSADDPYSQEEYESMLESGTWTQSGYVEGMGCVIGEVDITGSTSDTSSSGNTGNSSFLDYYDIDPSTIITTAMEQLFEDIGSGFLPTDEATDYVSDLNSLYEGYNSWKNGEISQSQFVNESIGTIVGAVGGTGTSSLWTCVSGGISVFSAYMTEAAYRMKNFVNGGWMNSQFGY